MQNLLISPTPSTPEINFSPQENIFLIRGTSSPEDVRAIYYPVVEWTKIFTDSVILGEVSNYSSENPLKFRIDLTYFNSSSEKFIYDIINELKRLSTTDVPVIIEWCFDEEDIDMRDAGLDISILVEMEFTFVQKNS